LRRRPPGGEGTRGGAASLRLPGVSTPAGVGGDGADLRRRPPGGEDIRGGAASLRLPGVSTPGLSSGL